MKNERKKKKKLTKKMMICSQKMIHYNSIFFGLHTIKCKNLSFSWFFMKSEDEKMDLTIKFRVKTPRSQDIACVRSIEPYDLKLTFQVFFLRQAWFLKMVEIIAIGNNKSCDTTCWQYLSVTCTTDNQKVDLLFSLAIVMFACQHRYSCVGCHTLCIIYLKKKKEMH